MNESQPILRIASKRREFTRVFKAKLRAEGSKAVKKIYGFGVVHIAIDGSFIVWTIEIGSYLRLEDATNSILPR